MRERINHRGDERGIALILALLILALLVALVLQFDAEARLQLKEAEAFRESVKARALSQAGLKAARAILQHDVFLKRLKKQEADTLEDVWAIPITNFQLGESLLSARLADERGKLNLNDLADTADPNVRAVRMDRFKRLFKLVSVDPSLADAIADWVDADDIAEPTGAETSYYQSQNPPYRAANGPLKTLAELRLIKGVTEEIVNRLAPYVTVYPANGGGWVNINTADPLVIQALDERITSGLALEIVQARPFTTPQDADRVRSFESIAKALRLANVYRVQTDHFSARLTVTMQDVTTTAQAVLRRSAQQGQTTLLSFQIL